MHPNHIPPRHRRSQPLRHPPKPPRQPSPIPSPGRHPHQPTRSPQHQHSQQQRAIHHHHHVAALALPCTPAKIIINLAMKSHPFPRIPLVLVTTASLLAVNAFAAYAADKKAPPAKPATQYAAFDTHPSEHLTIAADPCDDPKDCDFFRLPYVQTGFIPARVLFTNDGDAAL